MENKFVLGGKEFKSRFILGSGKYNLNLIKAAVEQAGVTADMSASDICDALKPAMTEISIDGLTGTGMVWNANGEPNKAPKAVKIVNGEYEMQ